MRKKGFTLVELMAVIIIISLIALLAVPSIVNQIKKTKKSNNKMVEDIVLAQAKKYVSDNKSDFEEDDGYCLSIDTLIDNDYIKEETAGINDYKDDKVVMLTYKDKFNYKIVDKDKCNIEEYQRIFVDNDGNKYTRIKYLESTGKQYINTDVVPIHNKIEVAAVMSTNGDNYSETGRYAFFGMWSNPFNFRLYKPNVGASGVLRVQYGGPYSDIYNIPLDDSILNIVFNYQSLIINGINQNIKFGANTNSSNAPIYIFASFSTNTGVEWLNYNCHIRCYSFKIYNDELVRDYIPVIDSSNRPCLFDKVSKTCFYNNGAGEFLWR